MYAKPCANEQKARKTNNKENNQLVFFKCTKPWIPLSRGSETWSKHQNINSHN